MSHFATLKFADYEVLDMRNQVYSPVMTMFWKGDKRVYTKSIDGDEVTCLEYHTSVGKAIQRLEIMGFSLKKAEGEFRAGIETLLREEELTESERGLFSNFSFDIWLRCMRELVERRVTRWNISERENEFDTDLLPYTHFVLGTFEYLDRDINLVPEFSVVSSFFHGFSVYAVSDLRIDLPYTDLRFVFRSILEICEAEAPVVMDYSALISWGTYTEDEDLCEDEYEHIEKTIILVEGSSDRVVLEKTLEYLHPDLCKYYSFMDFHSANIAGGAPALVHTLKAFISAGIRNKIIAVFDNDTAARDALRALNKVSLPENIRVLKLPPLDLARDYPTIGPQGNVDIDLNGLACSIELYFGKDILTDDDGNLTPVQWRGYNQTLQQYQGEILNKRRLQDKYTRFIEQVATSPEMAQGHDWASMKLVLEAIFEAFS